MRTLLFTVFACIASFTLNAQAMQQSIFTNGDRLNIHLTDSGEFYHSHMVEKGHTVYSLSKAYRVSAAKLYAYNQLEDGASISLGQELRIPIPSKGLFTGTTTKKLTRGHFIPVYYTIQPKDNLFRISRVYFNQPTEDLMIRNNLTDNNLTMGQELLIGWLPLDVKTPAQIEVEQESEYGEEELDIKLVDISVSYETQTTITDMEADTTISTDTIAALVIPEGFKRELLGRINYEENIHSISHSEVAHWDKTIKDNGSVFGLHNEAMINSYIQVYNPLVKRSIRVRVVGRIPYGTYTKDVKLVLSPRAAKQLGGVDRRFSVDVDYLIRK